MLPLIKPGIAAASIFTFRIAWNEFILALVLTDRATRTLPVAASLYITDIGVDWGKIMALGKDSGRPPSTGATSAVCKMGIRSVLILPLTGTVSLLGR